MAALYLHNALFANDTQPLQSPAPSSIAYNRSATASASRAPHDRHLSTHSLATVRTITTSEEHSHLSESVVHGAYSESSAGHALLARPPVYLYPDAPTPGLGPDTGSTLITREQRRQRELAIRRRLQRLRWAKRSVLLLIGAWTTYNTARYFVAVTTFFSHDRHIILLVLGSVSALSTAFVLLSFLLSAFAAYLGWKHASDLYLDNVYHAVQSLLGLSASLLSLIPPVVNLIFVFLWRSSAPEAVDVVNGRCTWDIDIFWAGQSSLCDTLRATPWRFWLAGAGVRLALTAAVSVAYCMLSHKYSRTRKPFRRRCGYLRRQSLSNPPMTGTASSPSARSFRPMTSTAQSPISFALPGRPASTEVSESNTAESSSTRRRPNKLRRSNSRRRSTQSRSSDSHRSTSDRPGSAVLTPLSPPMSPPASRHGNTTTLRFLDETSRNSLSSEDGPTTSPSSDNSGYGSPIRQLSGAYSFVPSSSATSLHSPARQSLGSANFPSDEDLTTFAQEFRSIVNQVARQTHAGMNFDTTRNDHPDFYSPLDRTPSPPHIPRPPAHEDRDYFPYMGHMIQRMPTIESLGSREVTSLATSSTRGDRSVHTNSGSRPPTRANTLSVTSNSNPPSRSNSLTASVALSPIEGSIGSDISDLPGDGNRPGSSGVQVASGSQAGGRPRTKSNGSYYATFSATGNQNATRSEPSSPV